MPVAAVGRPGTFWIYAGFGVLAVTFFSWRVPETSNRSLEEIEREVHNGESGPTAVHQRRRRAA